MGCVTWIIDTMKKAAQRHLRSEATNPMSPEGGESKLLQLLDWTDKREKLPFLQLGDLFFRNHEDLVFVVMSAACDLQYVPEAVSSHRQRERDDTVLLLPGMVRKLDEKQRSGLNTGLIRIDAEWFTIDWYREKLIGLPHCMIRQFLEHAGYSHSQRLETARAIELQQLVFHKASRIGLEVQPPLSKELSLKILAQKSSGIQQIGNVIQRGAVSFHARESAVVVLKYTAISEISDRLSTAQSGEIDRNLTLLQRASESFEANAAIVGKRTIKAPDANNISPIFLEGGHEKVKLDRIGITRGPVNVKEMNMSSKMSVVLSVEEV